MANYKDYEEDAIKVREIAIKDREPFDLNKDKEDPFGVNKRRKEYENRYFKGRDWFKIISENDDICDHKYVTANYLKKYKMFIMVNLFHHYNINLKDNKSADLAANKYHDELAIREMIES